MNFPSKTLAVALLGASSACFAGTAGAAPLGAPLALQEASSPMVQTVQWRGHRGGWGGWGGRGWGGGAGLAAGAIIGGAIAASRPYGYDYGYAPGYSYGYGPSYYSYGYDPGYSDYGYAPGGYVQAAPGGDPAYCQQRFRSYDPASGTYLGYDGYRHPCP